jgi:sugar lactone lactonase YvrE
VTASSGVITTVAGNGTYGYSGDNGLATSAGLANPFSVTVDSAGNLYIADTQDSRVRKVDTAGVITTVAGNGVCCAYSGDGGAATSAQLNNPTGLAVDGAGNLYIADTNNRRIRKVTAGGTITSIAGGSNGSWGDGGPAISAGFQNPIGLTVDASGNVYVADQTSIRVLTPAGTQPVLSIQSSHGAFTQGQNGATYTLTVSNAAGAGPASGSVGAADFPPAGLSLVSMDGSGWTCSGVAPVCTRGDALAGGLSYPPILVTVNVSPTALAQLSNQAAAYGGGSSAIAGATDLTIIAPSSAPAAPVLISPANGSVTGYAPTLSWGATAGATSYDVYFGTSSTPPLAVSTTSTSYPLPTLNGATTYYWAVGARNSAGANVSGTWSFTTSCALALNPSSATVGMGASTGTVPVNGFGMCSWTALSNAPWITVTSGASGFAVGTVGYSVAANNGPQRVGTLTIAGQTFTVTQAMSPLASQNYLISTLAGGAVAPTTALGTSVSIPVSIYGIAVDSSGNTYFASQVLNAVFKVDASGAVTRIAGAGGCCFSGDNGPALSAQLNSPFGVAVDASGNVYVADSYNQRVRKVDTAGVITTVAGNGACCAYSGDGGAATSAQLNHPTGLAVDGAGNLYIADSDNQRIRKVSAAGTITTVAGNGSYGYLGDGGAATSAEFRDPFGVAVDAAGNLYIADSESQRIRKVDTSGNITTVAGNGVCCGYSGDGGAAASAQIYYPTGVAVDAAGNLYIAEYNNQRIRKVSAAGTIATVAGNGGWGYSGDGAAATSAQLRNPSGVAVDASGNLYVADSGNARIRKVSAAVRGSQRQRWEHVYFRYEQRSRSQSGG